MSYELSIIVPTFNERENVPALISALETALQKIEWEVIFVDDDSPDGTGDVIRKFAAHDSRVRLLHRIGRRGLASACVEGMLLANAPFLAVIDADMQHDESLLPAMLEQLRNRDVELVIGSRYMPGGDIGIGLRGYRRWMSRFSTWLSLRVSHHRITDPMSGFFMLRRSLLDRTVHGLYMQGFKILLDIVTSAGRQLTVTELPYGMRSRNAGQSKLDATVVIEFLLMLLNKKFRGWVPIRFAMFLLVGLSGVAVHMTVLAISHVAIGSDFALSQGVATLVAMTSNFLLNNRFTYRDRRLRGGDLWLGLLSFYATCGLGAFVNVALAKLLFEGGISWTLAGLAGAAAGAIWNYAITSTVTWRAGKL
jgi:dolichol-phosphate mannosyltransferase